MVSWNAANTACQGVSVNVETGACGVYTCTCIPFDLIGVFCTSAANSTAAVTQDSETCYELLADYIIIEV